MCACPRCVCARCDRWECASESASRPAFPLPPLCVDEDEEEVEPRWAGPSWEGRLIQCSTLDMSSPGPASSSEPDEESEHRGDRPVRVRHKGELIEESTHCNIPGKTNTLLNLNNYSMVTVIVLRTKVP